MIVVSDKLLKNSDTLEGTKKKFAHENPPISSITDNYAVTSKL